MIKFIIVDDDKSIHRVVKKIITKATINTDEEIDVLNFECYNPDIEKIIQKDDSKKVYILDIDLQVGISGIQIAEIIRENDWDSEIIFITNHDKMFETVHRSVYSVFNFIEKFHNFEEKLLHNLVKIINKNFDNKLFKYSSRSVHLSLYFRSILYIYRETTERRLIIVTESNEYIVSMNLNEILTKLDDRFKFSHRACIINTDKIAKYNWNDGSFELLSGEVVHFLSKRYKKGIEK